MIWLYLIFTIAGCVGLACVALDWRRGLRQGLLGPTSAFTLMLLLSAGGLLWIRNHDFAGGNGPAPLAVPRPVDAGPPPEARGPGSGPALRAAEQTPIPPPSPGPSMTLRLIEAIFTSVVGALLVAGVGSLWKARVGARADG